MLFSIFRRKERSKSWNVFRIITSDNEHAGDDLCFEIVRKIFKVMTYVGVFILILCCTLINKSTLLFITSNMRNDLWVHCRKFVYFEAKKQGNDTIYEPKTAYRCLSMNNNETIGGGENDKCLQYGRNMTEIDPNQTYQMKICEAITVRWIWAGILLVCAPYIFVFFRSMWKVCFKRKKSPTFAALLLVSRVIKLKHIKQFFLALYLKK